jgi:putative Mn2+ efflux pump MntP
VLTTPFSIAILSLSMSADAFAAAIGRGAVHRPPFAAAVRGGLVFGLIEAVTPILGWALGVTAAGLVEQIDHWIAFTLLAAVGAKMIWEATRPAELHDEAAAARRGLLALVATAVGTSIDAAAVGITLAFIGANIWVIATAIGATTFVASTTGMLVGKVVGARFGRYAELAGGVALIIIGTLILIDHLGAV